jgi:hypothetical protein
MSQLLIHDPGLVPVPPAANPSDLDQGVIEEARRRQRRRRIRIALASVITAAFIGVIAWTLSGRASHAGPAHAGRVNRAQTVNASDRRAQAFNIRLVPMLIVGRAGWCMVIEENGVTGGSACGGVPTPSRPFLQIYGWGRGGSHYETAAPVVDPQVTAILVDGKRRVAAVPLPGLPYGLRGARIVTSTGSTLLALDEHAHQIPQHWINTPLQATVHSWRSPSWPPQGSCRLRADGLPGLSVRGGEVASAIRPFPGGIVGHAFLPCVVTEYYMQHAPLRATVVLDAAHPRARATALPDFKAVRGAPGFFSEGSLTARRYGNAWLIVGQGSGLAQRMRLLGHLTPTIEL